MGLDMFLYGVEREEEEELGYWRKHPDLHGFIVNEFAKGVDECQEIPLKVEDIHAIIRAVLMGDLPKTQGFFFGESYSPQDPLYEDQAKNDLSILHEALEWLGDSPDTRRIYYQASW